MLIRKVLEMKIKAPILLLIFLFILSGCATKMAYLNSSKTAEDLENDKNACQAEVDNSDFKDPDLKKNKFNECMKKKDYKVVSEETAQKAQGFVEVWMKPGIDLNSYEAVYIEKVDLSRAEVDNSSIPGMEVSDKEIQNLGEEMLKRFSKAINEVIPVISDRSEIPLKKTLILDLKLKKIFQTKIGAGVVLKVAGYFSPVPLPGGPEGVFSFQGEISDFTSREKLITFSDEVKSSKNSSLSGREDFSRWEHAYNVMDYWADQLAALLAKERGQKYKLKSGWKII